MIKTDLANGRASPVSESSVRPGKKGAALTLVLARFHVFWAGKLSVFSINPISVTKDLGGAFPASDM